MRDYHLHELTGSDFESLVIHLCREVLGTGTVNFSEGKDGGRDGTFCGTANNYPDKHKPWSGNFIIQAKRIANPAASCSDSEFDTILQSEAPKIKKLRIAKECDAYLIFTNRKLTANTNSKLVRFLNTATGLKKTGILGVETITSHLDANEKVVKLAGLNHFRGPLRIQPEELRDIITAFHKHRTQLSKKAVAKYSLDYVELNNKNTLNNLGTDYFNYILANSHSYFNEIDKFIQNPINAELREMYFTVADELQGKIITSRDSFGRFEEIIEHVYDFAIETMPELKPRRRLVNVFLHFMYCTCDIGKKK